MATNVTGLYAFFKASLSAHISDYLSSNTPQAVRFHCNVILEIYEGVQQLESATVFIQI